MTTIELVKKYSEEYKIESRLLYSIISTESNFNPNAVRYEIDYRWFYKLDECKKMVGCTTNTMRMIQQTSWGYTQIMGAIYYELGGKGWATTLLDPEINLKYCCEYLKKIITKKYLTTAEEIYIVYNAGSIRKTIDGKLVNQDNVDRFMSIYNRASSI